MTVIQCMLKTVHIIDMTCQSLQLVNISVTLVLSKGFVLVFI